jgi:hypothetical protein
MLLYIIRRRPISALEDRAIKGNRDVFYLILVSGSFRERSALDDQWSAWRHIQLHEVEGEQGAGEVREELEGGVKV